VPLSRGAVDAIDLTKIAEPLRLTTCRTLKPGDPVTWNGTDFLVINDSNRIKEVNIAQDMMELFHVLGMTSVPV